MSIIRHLSLKKINKTKEQVALIQKNNQHNHNAYLSFFNLYDTVKKIMIIITKVK